MIVRLWFRRNGHDDGLWWTLECDGVEHHASGVLGDASFVTETMPGPTPNTPLGERRHVVSFDAERVAWSGTVAKIHSTKARTDSAPSP